MKPRLMTTATKPSYFHSFSCTYTFEICFTVPILLLLHSPWLLVAESLPISVGTYNLWNVMFNWEVRLHRIADTIRQSDLDTVVFQEVRMQCEHAPATTQSCPSQLDELRWLLPDYKWVLAYPAGSVTKAKSSICDDWQLEGLGVISRRPILSSKAVALRQNSFQDSNKRIALHVKVRIGQGDDDVVDIVAVHFSYDPNQQCDNAKDIMELINGPGLKRPIILGDFNVYDEMSPAVGQFVGLPNGHLACPKVMGGDDRMVFGSFQDVWLSVGQSHLQGLSFSNMPSPGLQSRPDRILISKRGAHVTNVGLVGGESLYWDHYQVSATMQRARTVLTAAYYSFIRLDGYFCLHDCGPHGSCRCGVCVKGGNSNNCHLPHCSECSGGKFVIFLVLSCVTIFMSLIFVLSVIRILVVSARFSQDDLMDILGHRCCLCNRQLFQFKFRMVPRRFKLRLVNMLRLYNLPPAVAALASLVLLCCSVIVIYYMFQDAMYVVVSVLPEEKFPSDHKMVFARLKIL